MTTDIQAETNWPQADLDLLYDLPDPIRQRVMARAKRDGISPTQAYQKIAEEDVAEDIEDRARNHRW